MIYAVVNQKGGSQKTSTTVNLAAALGELGKSVLVVDLDPQGSSTVWLGHEPNPKGLFECLESSSSLTPVVCGETSAPLVSLIPADPWLSHADRVLAGMVGSQIRLRKLLHDIQGSWDFVFIDSPPALGFLTVSAIVAANRLIIPVESSAMGLGGLADLLKTVEQAKDSLNPDLEIAGVVLSRFDGRTVVGRDVWKLVRRHMGREKVFDMPIRENVRMRSAWSAQKPILSYDTTCIAASDYRDLAEEFLGREAAV